MDIEGVGEALVTQLQAKGLVGDPADLFFLTMEQLRDLDRFAEKSATNIYERIQTAKRRPLERILIALGIRHVGGTTAEDLAHWLAARLPRDADLAAVFEVLRNVSVDELRSIEGIGGVVAESIKEYFSRPEEQEFLDKLVRAGITPVMPAPRPAAAAGPFAGKTVVFTGTLERRSREDAEALVRSLGGKITATVSAKTDLVVAGPGAGSKLEKANKIGVRVVDEETFEGMLP
jgi:DNA ligase (NAD+)